MCQVKMATDAIVLGLQLDSNARERLYEKAAQCIDYHQRRNASARTSHTRTTIRKLHREGTKLTGLPRRDENTSYRWYC